LSGQGRIAGRRETGRLFVSDVFPGEVVGTPDGVGESVEAVARQPVDAGDATGLQCRDDVIGEGGHTQP
jgi:hypothetical protein